MGGGKKFVGNCHIMHAFAAHAHTELYKFKIFLGGGIPGPPLYETLTCISYRSQNLNLIMIWDEEDS